MLEPRIRRTVFPESQLTEALFPWDRSFSTDKRARPRLDRAGGLAVSGQ